MKSLPVILARNQEAVVRELAGVTPRDRVVRRLAALGMTGAKEDEDILTTFDAATPETQARLAELDVADLLDHHYMVGSQGDVPWAFAHLASRLTQVVDRVLSRSRLQSADIDEARSDVFLRLWRHRLRYNVLTGTVRALVSTIARNRAIDSRRAGRRAAAVVSLAAGSFREPESRDLDPAVAVELQEEEALLLRRLRRVLAAAKPKAREAWRMIREQGLSYAEAAARLGVPQGTIATWVHRICYDD